MGKQSKSKAKRKTSAWFRRHVHDPHVKRAEAEGRRSRAAFKLKEIMDRHGLHLKPDAVVVDLGCAPGSWCEEVARRLGKNGLLIGIDLLPVEPIADAILIQADFDSEDGLKAVEKALQGRDVHLVLSDMAPEMSGNKLVDQASMMNLNDLTLSFAVNHLREGGHLLLK
ncbi:MAG: SAM-dependent methyltransferase, partial [Mariprofundaceae bacterium]